MIPVPLRYRSPLRWPCILFSNEREQIELSSRVVQEAVDVGRVEPRESLGGRDVCQRPHRKPNGGYFATASNFLEVGTGGWAIVRL